MSMLYQCFTTCHYESCTSQLLWVAKVEELGEMVVKEWIIRGMQSEAVFANIKVKMAQEKLVLGFGKREIEVNGDEIRSRN